jgi:hypothetical protein
MLRLTLQASPLVTVFINYHNEQFTDHSAPQQMEDIALIGRNVTTSI